MKTVRLPESGVEDRLSAELYQFGIMHLSIRAIESPDPPRPPEQILAASICQPGSQRRTALMGLFILHPEFAELLPSCDFLFRS